MDSTSISSGSSDDETSAANRTPKEEELVTYLQLRLTASHLPKVRSSKKLLRKSPDAFATVASIVRKNGTANNQTVSPYSKTRYGEKQFLSSSFSFETGSPEEDKMVEWGCTEVIHNSRSPQWVETIPLKYEYGSELFFYVRILQAESNKDETNRKSLTTTSQQGGLSPMSKGSDDSSVASESFYNGTPKKNRMGFCFGTALFEVGDILGSRNYTKVKRLKNGGCVYARVEPMTQRDEDKLRFRFQFQALNLNTTCKRVRKSLGLGSDPSTVLEISRPHDSPTLHSWVTVFRSRPVFNSRNPCWDLAEVDLECCCRNADLSKTVRLSIYRIRGRNKQQKLIGMCETTMHNILANASNGEEGPKPEASSERDFFLQKSYQKLEPVGNLRVKVAFLTTLSGRAVAGALSPSSQNGCMSPATTPAPKTPIARAPSSDSTSTAGDADPFNVDLRQLSVMRLSASVTESATNLSDFIDNGGQLDFCVAIDFTSSNGNPLEPGTLHFQGDDVLNDYEEAITSIGNAIDPYSASGYSVYGFGAKFSDGIVRHLFQCGQDPTVNGVEGILNAYRGMFRSGGITMSGPTVFVKAIQAAAVRAHKSKTTNVGKSPRYTVLLIVTDGIMDNFEETKEKLAVYAEVPLSVIIVGVGRADFQSMYALCEAPRTQQSTLSRKNTTFVEFRQHQHDPRSLAQAALYDLPKQLSDYMIQNGLTMH